MIEQHFYWQLFSIYLALLGVPVLLVLPVVGLALLGRGACGACGAWARRQKP